MPVDEPGHGDLPVDAVVGARAPGEEGSVEPEGGDPACWMHLVCPCCGRVADEDPPPATCPHCGEERP